ncbi:hypothetical protein H5P28_02150 [Ruficoccus amylovorans]|uniref:Uncharacterized protein n=1 Tax=Ruficoccus amylovorans TaxID=1804625 RepID=A0A842H951_9BACT|nr:hypothetical protein [Ruficoccus amylovorans]MBC2593053.1 hypothetical protein [Ruficoccus amylovorans]
MKSRHSANNEAGGAPGSAPSPAALPDPFREHLRHLSEVRRQTNAIMEHYNPGHATARGAMEQAWQMLFSLLQNLPLNELSEFNTLSSIIHRLCSSFTQIGSLEMKLCDYETDRQEREERKRKLLSELESARSQGGLSLETIREIEQTLKLL